MSAVEMAVAGSDVPRRYIVHTYLRGAVALRLDLAQ